MAAVWFFQSNPDRYDIDAALENLDEIHWRAPQHTSKIAADDVAILWRSGRDAGIIGIGRVKAPPAARSAPAEEEQFDRGDGDDSPATRVLLAVRPVPFIPKSTVEDITELTGHQILTAPMGTVFPVDEAQWAALRRLMPSPPTGASTRRADSDRELPAVFAWQDRYKSVTPLPGGGERYLATLSAILERVAETQPESLEMSRWLMREFEVGERRAGLTVNFLQRLSLLHSGSARLSLTDYATRWLQTREPLFLLALVHSRIRFVGEFLAHLQAEPRSPEDLLRHANDRYLVGWSTRAQIDRRRHLLGGVGAVDVSEGGGLTLTELGREALDVLTIEPPTDPSAPRPVVSKAEKVPDAPASDSVPDPGMEEIVQALEVAAHNSADPDAFEVATRDAFAFLGFDAQWLGGSGKTDVLLVAQLGLGDAYRVIVDTKSTANDAVTDGQIDWVTLQDHKAHYDADFVVLVAPAFAGPRVRERAETQGVALVDVAALVSLVRQHAEAPLGLDAYREVFVRRGSVEAVVEEADETRRLLVLAADILRLVESLQDDEGPLDANDLYWNLKSGSDDQFDPPSRDDVAEMLTSLARPPLGLLRALENGYSTLGSRATVLRRLRILTGIVEAWHSAPSD